MPNSSTSLDAAPRPTAKERLQLAFALTREDDGRSFATLAEAWAKDNLGMEKADRSEPGIDGVLPDGRSLQVNAKKAGAHSDSATYVTPSPSTRGQADDLLIVFVDYETCTVTRKIGSVRIASLKERRCRYYVGDMIEAKRG